MTELWTTRRCASVPWRPKHGGWCAPSWRPEARPAPAAVASRSAPEVDVNVPTSRNLTSDRASVAINQASRLAVQATDRFSDAIREWASAGSSRAALRSSSAALSAAMTRAPSSTDGSTTPAHAATSDQRQRRFLVRTWCSAIQVPLLVASHRAVRTCVDRPANRLPVVARVLGSRPDRDHAAAPTLSDPPAMAGHRASDVPTVMMRVVKCYLNILLGVPAPVPHVLTIYNERWRLSTALGELRRGRSAIHHVELLPPGRATVDPEDARSTPTGLTPVASHGTRRRHGNLSECPGRGPQSRDPGALPSACAGSLR